MKAVLFVSAAWGKCAPKGLSGRCAVHLTILILAILLILGGSQFPAASSHIAFPVGQSALPAGFRETPIASGLDSPTAMAIAPDGRIFICEQEGSLRVVKNGALIPTPFMSASVDSYGERGLLGVAVDPNFATNRFLYVYYTVPTSPAHNRVSRFTANGDVAAAGSELVLLELGNLSSATNHNGGALHFGLDGKLYIAVGDNANSSNSQTLNSVFGKILRINLNGTIPADNPFYHQLTGSNRAIWALGLRNPFTFNFHATTGRMFINDVGQGDYEEVNDGVAGKNFGWPLCEGPCSNPNPNFSDPVYSYFHDQDECAITGGVFYSPGVRQFPAQYAGKYFFADYCAGWIRTLDPTNGSVTNFSSALAFPVDLQVSDDGSLYYLQRGGNSQLWKVEYIPNEQGPAISLHPVDQTVLAGRAATFTVAASGSAPLSYQWLRNGVPITGAITSGYMLNPASLAENGARFSCRVTNASGNATSNEALLTVTTNQPPVATIVSPSAGTFFGGGQVINYSGTGIDSEDGNLPPSAYTWRVDFHHDTHTHPFLPPNSGVKSGSFTIPTTGETATDVLYRIYLTVTDSNGSSQTVFRDLFPRIVTLSLASSPSGMQLNLDGQPVAAGLMTTSVVGVERTLSVNSPQNVDGRLYYFNSWSDSGAATHTISTPAVNTTYTATFTSCRFILSSSALRARPSAVNSAVDVTVQNGCPWTATSNANWITLTGGNSGNGNGRVLFSVSANRGSQRAGTLTIGGEVFRITQLAAGTLAKTAKSDFDGDGKTDLSLWRASDGSWRTLQSYSAQSQTRMWGAGFAPYHDIPVPGDYDGDGRTDLAVWRPLDGNWYILKSSNLQFQIVHWGEGAAPYNDVPVPGDYDGDGVTDFAVWRKGSGNWYVLRSSDKQLSITPWGAAGAPYNDLPVPADYDGDGKTDLAVWRQANGYWYIRRSSDGRIKSMPWGAAGAPYFDLPVPADYDGDGAADLAVRRKLDHVWYILRSADNSLQMSEWGLADDTPIPGDYDGDGMADIGVWRPLDGTWQIRVSSNGSVMTATHGQNVDVPLPARHY